MFRVQWDTDTRGVRLSTIKTDETLGITPRPVFFEELDLLKLNKLGYSYQKCKEPLMWACNKQYYYNGELCFEVKGANIYDAPTVVFQDGKEKLELLPVDVPEMLRRCENLMFIVENEAIDFIRDQYVMYSSATKAVEKVKANQIDFIALKEKLEKQTKQEMAIVKQDCESFDIMPMINAKKQHKKNLFATKIDKFIASFSGGKDSQVVLDLCTRAIPPTEFDVMYSDTGYELANSISVYEQSKDYYTKLYPNLKFALTKNHAPVLSYWDKIGTPSDTHRWCCSVMKTAPLYRSLKIPGTNRQAKVLTFEGVRAEESTRRSEYERVGRSKHNTTLNASPILYWNNTEVFLYLLKYDLPFNKAYREGNARVGCIICPYSSTWDDMISNNLRKDDLKPFLQRLENQAKKDGVPDVNDYIKERKWKLRAGGRGINFPSSLEVISYKPDLVLQCSKPQKDIFTFLQAVGKYTFDGKNGELKYDNKIYSFSVNEKNNVYTINFANTWQEPTFQGLIKRVFYKSVYCINCESCEVECPTGALSILPEAKIDPKKCISCRNCLMFHDMGCIAAKSLSITGNTENQNAMKLIGYNTFGLKEEWLTTFFDTYETYFSENMHGLHPKEQLPNFVKWLVHAGILNDSKTKQLTETGKLLRNNYKTNPSAVWEIIWINLTYNSPIAVWYKEKTAWNMSFTAKDMEELIKRDYPNDNPRTIKNIFTSLFRTLKESPIGKMGLCVEAKGNTKCSKVPCENISKQAVAFSLYKYAENIGTKIFKVSDLYNEDNVQGIYREFGLPQSQFEKLLHTLNGESNRVLTADLNMGLEHITLRDDLNSDDVLKILF